jgi:hypothetical protein
VVWRLAKAGLPIDAIEQTLAEYPNGIAQKYKSRLREEIERSYGKWQRSGGIAGVSAPDDPDGQDKGTGRASAAQRTSAHDWDEPDFSILDDRRGELPAFPLDVLSPAWHPAS